MSDLQQYGFDYGQLAAVDATEVRAASERIKIRMKRTAEDIVAIGQDLIQTKQRLGHGQFGEWLKAEFDMGGSSAKRIMDVAERFGSEFTNLANLNASILYQLAAPSTPEEVVDRTIEARNTGETVTNADVKRWKDEALQSKRDADEARKAQAEAASQAEDIRIQHQDAISRLDKAKEEYRSQRDEMERIRALPPVTVTVDREVVPKPYKDEEQAMQGLANRKEDIEAAMKRARAEEDRAQRNLENIRLGTADAIRASEKEKAERTHIQSHQVALTALRTSVAGFLKSNADNFMALDGNYMQAADQDYLLRVENHLREMADKLAAVRDVSANYAEYEVVNG